MTHHRTPILQDKRFLLCAGVIAAVLGLTAVDKAPNEQVLTFLGLTVGAFMGQSQWGQTARTNAAKLPIQDKSA